MMISVAELMMVVETGDGIPGSGHIEFVALAAIAQVETPLIVKRAVPPFRAEPFKSSRRWPPIRAMPKSSPKTAGVWNWLNGLPIVRTH